jgi:hypothetical protein
VEHKEKTIMKLNTRLTAVKPVLFASVLLAVCLSAIPANAQSVFKGDFTLLQKTYWGDAVLPVGDYQLSVTTTGLPSMLIVRDAVSGKKVAMLAPQTREQSTTGESALLIGTRGGRQVIHSLRVAELGLVFISDPALAHGRGASTEAGKAQAVPVIVAKK